MSPMKSGVGGRSTGKAPQVVAMQPGVAMSSTGQACILSRWGGDSQLRCYSVMPGGNWSGYQFGEADSLPAIVVRSTGEVDVVAQQDGGVLYFWATSDGNWEVSPPLAVGSTAAQAIAVSSTGLAYVVAQGPNNELLCFSAIPGGEWNASTIAPAGSISSAPAIAVSSTGEVGVVAQGPNNELFIIFI